jgi:plastocyanin
MTVSVGTTVTWVNGDNTSHTSTSNNGAFDTGTIAPGGSASFRFQSAGSFPYHCTFHPGMIATITVQ